MARTKKTRVVRCGRGFTIHFSESAGRQLADSLNSGKSFWDALAVTSDVGPAKATSQSTDGTTKPETGGAR